MPKHNWNFDRLATPLGLVVLFGVTAFLIFHDLGVPSLWLDEAASPLNARYPFDYILTLSRTLEEHPPLFYLVIKAVMAFGTADTVLRLPPALAGFGCVVLMVLLGRRLFSWPAGLLAGALWLALPQDLWLSRMARPYSLWLFFFLGALLFLLRWLHDGRARDLWLLLAANTLMVLTHYVSFFLMAAEGVCLALAGPPRPLRERRRILFAFGTGAVAITAAVYFLLLRHSEIPHEILNYGDTPAELARTLWNGLLATLYYFESPIPRLAWLAAVLLAFALLWRRNRTVLRVLVPLVLVPLALLVTFGKSTGLYSRHLSFLAVPFCLAMAGAVTALRPSKSLVTAVTTVVLALTAANALILHKADFYTLHSYQVPAIGNNYKQTADALAATYRPGTIISYSNDFFGNAVAWYLARKPHPNPVDDQRLTPADTRTKLLYVASTHHGYLAWNDREFRDKFGPDVTIAKVDNTTIYGLTVPRTPVQRIDALPASIDLTAAYPGFFATAATIDDVRFHQNARSPAVVPTRNDQESSVGLCYENQAPAQPQDVFLNIIYDNTSQNSQLAAKVTFDNEPPTRYPLSSGYDASHQRQLRLHREAPYHRLTVDILMDCASLTPTLNGGNLETLRLREVQAFFCPERDGKNCRDTAERKLAASLLDNYLEERFLTASTVTQNIQFPSHDDNLIEQDGEGQIGWTRMLPRTPDRPGELHLDVTTAKPRLRFFPRVGRDSTVLVWALGKDGKRQLLFGLYNESNHWTPVSAQYEIVVPPQLRGKHIPLVIELSGRWAQLWRHGQSIFF